VRIDLFANDVTVVDRNGGQQRYSIERKNASSGSNNNALASGPTSSSNTRINADCFTFKAYTQGGNGGLRFQGNKDFHRLNTKAKTGQVCHKGSLVMEISKTEPNTTTIVEINGNRYTFVAGEQEDQLLNTWYRKRITLNVGR
jgi:hypothetical protein